METFQSDMGEDAVIELVGEATRQNIAQKDTKYGETYTVAFKPDQETRNTMRELFKAASELAPEHACSTPMFKGVIYLKLATIHEDEMEDPFDFVSLPSISPKDISATDGTKGKKVTVACTPSAWFRDSAPEPKKSGISFKVHTLYIN